MSIISKVLKWIKSLFSGKKAAAVVKPTTVVAPTGRALSEELNKPALSGRALAEELNKQSQTAPAKKTTAPKKKKL